MTKGLSPQEKDTLSSYFQQIFLRPGSSEYALFICFEAGVYSREPLEIESRLGNPAVSFPVSFFYGDRDWMDWRAGDRVLKKNKFYNPTEPKEGLSQLYMIPDSDHHMYIDNPVDFAQAIITDVQYFLAHPPPTGETN